MEDKEIIKALECCKKPVGTGACKDCPLDKDRPCTTTMIENALDLINRQQAEIKELEAEIDEQYEQAEADILGNIPDGGAGCHWCIDGHRKGAIKEFAERLKQRTRPTLEYCEVVLESDIDNLVEEMVGEDK